MKKALLIIILIIPIFSLVVSCQQNNTPTKKEDLIANEDMKDFIEPEPSNWVKFSNIAREYMYYRTQAVVNNDMQMLWNQYPSLKADVDIKKGINVEEDEMESLNNHFDIIDANFNIESYERMKVKTIDERNAIVLVHGSIVYLRNDFDESGGEYVMKIFLEKTNDQWTVVKTDEYTQSEYKEWFKSRQ